jgi:ADP-ribose pyrophosphatase YjhB (NUDIX family)
LPPITSGWAGWNAIEPRHGKWTLPSGVMENNETMPQAAVRETVEEAGARIELCEV